MRKRIKALAAISAVATGLAAAPALYAHDSENSAEPMIGPGTMGMMQQMSAMMEGCGKMMQSAGEGLSERPNEQWRKDKPQDGNAADSDG